VREQTSTSNKEDNIKTGTDNNQHDGITRQDVYTRVTDRILADLEQGVRPWTKPWSAEHAAGKITRPLRHNGTPSNRSPSPGPSRGGSAAQPAAWILRSDSITYITSANIYLTTYAFKGIIVL